MELKHAKKLARTGTNGELQERIRHCKQVIANRELNGQDASATRESLAIVEAEYSLRKAGKANPTNPNYDRFGRYVGTPANENGWTA